MGEYTRRVDIKVEIDIWDWSTGSLSNTLDVTTDILTYRFQKTLKTPEGSCQLTMVPQSVDTHILDIISPMDVIRIYEFGTLKFVGYIIRVSYSGSIGNDGKPNRDAVITAGQFGGILTTATIGWGMGYLMGTTDLISSASKLFESIANATIDSESYASLIKLLITNFKSFLTDVKASNFATYLDNYLTTDGLSSTKTPAIPRTFQLYSGTEKSISFWQVAEQLAQKPFNEFFIDNGPRKIFIDGKVVNLSDKSHLILRETPFDGTVGGVSATSFQDMGDPVYIDEDHLVQFDLGRSMEEVYTLYNIKSAAFTLSDEKRFLLGSASVDKKRMGKYLFRPLSGDLFYSRMEKTTDTAADSSSKAFQDASKQAGETLYAWFQNNDEYLSGALTHMVPSDNADDPKIGDKVSVFGLTGEFYVESIAHTWQYQGPLISNLTVTRGYNKDKRIELKDKIFKRSPIT